MPKFTAEEQYLISVMRGDIKDSAAFMWTYLLSGAVIAGFAAYFGSIAMMLSAFVVVYGVRIYEERFQSQWRPVARSVILKYDAASAGAPETQISN